MIGYVMNWYKLVDLTVLTCGRALALALLCIDWNGLQ
eukprot:COSAG04_NODE_26790_length_290_cov_1.361257_1_plen_36_part_01